MADILSPKTKVEASHVPERPDEAGGQPQVDNGASATIEPSLQPDPAETHPADSDADDSGFSDASESVWTASLASSIAQYRQENGRTYHSYSEGSPFSFPTLHSCRTRSSSPNIMHQMTKYHWISLMVDPLVADMKRIQTEQDRLDLQNALFELSMGGKLALAPVKVVHNCLDVGTGTGIWAIDFGDEHPESQVIGVDLSPIQPTWVPPNVQFFVDDVEDVWHYRQHFDLIHSRMMVGSFQNWPAFMNNAFSWLRPNGYLELQDVESLGCDDGTLIVDPPSCRLAEWWSLVLQGFKSAGRPVDAASKHKERLLAAGFIDIQETLFKWPINAWPKDKHMKKIGLFSCENTSQALEAFAMAPLTRFLGWSKEEVQVLTAGARADLKNPRLHAYWTIRIIYGKKPGEAQPES